MKQLISPRRLAALTVLSGLCTPILIATQTAQAAPPANAPAFGFRRGLPDRNRNVTLTGVVTSDTRGQDRFRVRLNDGRNIEVISRKNEPKRLSNGDRVTLFGDFENGLFIADKVRVVENVGNGAEGNGNQNITVVGVVTRDLAGQDRFTVRLEDGRTTQVISRKNEPLRISRGDRVQLRGDFERGLFIADRVRILDNAGGGNGGEQATTLRGRVTRDFFSRDFEIDRDNGGKTRVRSQRAEPIRLSQGDRVELKGRFDGSLFIAREVDITRNDDSKRVDFPAVVLRRTDAGHMTVRGENGRTYKLVSNVSMVRFNRDDRVRVKGSVQGDTVFVDSVTMLRNR